MDANNDGAPPKPVPLKNETPAIFSELASHAVVFLEKYGWFILIGVILAVIIWSKLEPYWAKWKRKRDEEREQKHIGNLYFTNKSHFCVEYKLMADKIENFKKNNARCLKELFKLFYPVTLAKTQEAIEISRRKMQEITDKKTAEFAEKMKEVEERKRQEKISDWERHQQGRGYRSKQTKPESEQNEQNGKAKPKRSTRLRNTDYSPLGGSSSGSSFRPSGRRNTGGG